MKTCVREWMESCALIAFDLDGTLAHNGVVSRRTKEALIRAHELGCILVLATGRAQYMIPRSVRSLPFSYVITSSGARTIHNATGEAFSVCLMTKDMAVTVIDAVDETAASFGVHLDGLLLMDKRRPRTMGNFGNVTFIKHMFTLAFMAGHVRRVKNVRKALAGESRPIEKLNCMFSDSEHAQSSLGLLRQMGGIEAVTTTGYDIEVTAGSTSKGIALKALCEHLAVPKEHVIVFGDSGNDLSMLSEAGCFVATENASDDVKAAAHHVTLSAKDDGVAVVLEGLFGKGEKR